MNQHNALKISHSCLTLAMLVLLCACTQQNIMLPSDTTVPGKVATPAKPDITPVTGQAPVATPAPSSRKDELVVLTAGESAKLTGSASLEFIRVVSDSRCPAGTQCIWAGEVTIELKLHSGTEEKIFTLTDRTKTITILGMQVELLTIGRDNVASFRVKKI